VTFSRDDALTLDAGDQLSCWFEEFLVDDPELVYLDGNSLGRTPLRTVRRVQEVMTAEWARDLALGWDRWVEGPSFEPHDDMRRLLLGTPGILGLVAAEEGIGVVADAGMSAIAAKGRHLTETLLSICDELGLETITPRDSMSRGAHVGVRRPDAAELVTVLARDHKVVADFRQPDVIRLGCSPLTTRFTDVWDGAHAIARCCT
jgi:kynureninase